MFWLIGGVLVAGLLAYKWSPEVSAERGLVRSFDILVGHHCRDFDEGGERVIRMAVATLKTRASQYGVTSCLQTINPETDSLDRLNSCVAAFVQLVDSGDTRALATRDRFWSLGC